MDILFLGIVIFLFMLAVFDLSVGVSNDAVNFMTSAIGSKAASFKKVMIVAAIGVFIGATMSNGWMWHDMEFSDRKTCRFTTL